MALIIDDTLISNVADNLRAAMTTDPKMRKAIQQHIREALWDARKEMINSAHFANGDPRQSLRAIRNSVYEKILGGQINIKRSRKDHGGGNSYTPPRKLAPGQRGGNRRPRSERTEQINRGSPLDRQWILNILNKGTKTRVIGFRNTVKGNRTRYENRVYRINRGDKARTGNRGSIAPRNWFMPAAEKALQMAMQRISEMIEIEAAAIASGEK
jgi:hypothetical protein